MRTEAERTAGLRDFGAQNFDCPCIKMIAMIMRDDQQIRFGNILLPISVCPLEKA